MAVQVALKQERFLCHLNLPPLSVSLDQQNSIWHRILDLTKVKLYQVVWQLSFWNLILTWRPLTCWLSLTRFETHDTRHSFVTFTSEEIVGNSFSNATFSLKGCDMTTKWTGPAIIIEQQVLIFFLNFCKPRKTLERLCRTEESWIKARLWLEWLESDPSKSRFTWQKHWDTVAVG